MNNEERVIARLLFQLKVLQATGTAFEDIFTKVMSYAEPGFCQIKPQGRAGDRKNDGYIKDKGVFFQVYAPEDPVSVGNVTKAIRKAHDDFKGLAAYWGNFCPVREYFFVYNDKYRGSFPEIEKTLAQMKSAYGLDQCGTVLAKHLEDKVFRLGEDEMMSVVGFIPSLEPIDLLDYGMLTEVVQHVLTHFKPIGDEDLFAPDFDEKVEYNMLSVQVKAILDLAFHQVGEVDGYFDHNSEYMRQAVRDRIKNMYMRAVERHKTYGLPQKNDLVFWSLVRDLQPRADHQVASVSKRIQDAVFVLIAYYFHSCDIFENPSA